ncbi:lymphoid-specific helicase-like isoform X2 [Linepithema humile]
MHLLNQSKFYSSYLKDKINEPRKEPSKAVSPKKKKRRFVNNENVPPKKLSKVDSGKYNMQVYLTDINKVQVKRKKMLSTEEIEVKLAEDSDTEANVPADNAAITPKYFCGDLRDYQQIGLKWLKTLYENALNGILADEMGLGKTIQVIAFICHLMEKKQPGPFLIIAPLSTIPNWLMEFERFAPDIPVLLFYGSSEERKAAYKQIKKKHHVEDDYKTQPVVITTYEIILKETRFFQSEQWRYFVIDEGQRIKNSKCLLVKVLKTLQCTNKLVLTGTPLQNDLAELWSLLHFLLPDIFDDLSVFESWFDAKEFQHNEGNSNFWKQEEEKHVLASLREILKPFMLRREKEDVCLEIPPKKELIVYAPLTQLQHDLYRAVLNYDFATLTKIEQSDLIIPNVNDKRPKRKCVLKSKYGSVEDDFSNTSGSSLLSKQDEDSNDTDTWKGMTPVEEKNLSLWKQYTDVTERNRDFLIRIQFQRRLTMYKKIVNHPYLVHCPLDSVGLPKIDNDLIRSSGKLLVLDAMLMKLKAQGHKVLLFSTWTMILDMIEDYLMLRNYKYVRLDGLTKIEQRKEDIQAFNNNPEIFLFLISTKAGGVGLNLAGADTVIMYDSDWNPQVDIQAMARCHRIGQTKPVVIYRLCTKGTIDETIIKRADAKRFLEKMVISKQLPVTFFNKDTVLKLKQVMESKEYKVVASEKEVFTEAELNKLLDRSDMINKDK